MRPLIAIVGPTGSGKSDLSLHICKTFGGEVINCDSLQIYRYFDIGTAKLPIEERHGIPHHMLDILNPDEIFTAGEFADRARPLLERIDLPVVVGGTGFYLRALLDGLAPAPTRDEGLRAMLSAREERRSGSLHRLLSRFDPRASRLIHSNDVPKTIRALEVYLLTRRPMSSWFDEPRNALRGFLPLKIGLAPPRDELYRRLDQRCERMFASGLLDEVRGILDMGWPSSSKPFESHGYAQALELLAGRMTQAQALEDAQRNTRRYAKRQMTWFRKEPGVEWFPTFGDDPSTVHAVNHRVGKYLSESTTYLSPKK